MIFVIQGRYTRDALSGMVEKPEDIAAAGSPTDIRTTIAMSWSDGREASGAAGKLSRGFRSAGTRK